MINKGLPTECVMVIPTLEGEMRHTSADILPRIMSYLDFIRMKEKLAKHWI